MDKVIEYINWGLGAASLIISIVVAIFQIRSKKRTADASAIKEEASASSAIVGGAQDVVTLMRTVMREELNRLSEEKKRLESEVNDLSIRVRHTERERDLLASRVSELSKLQEENDRLKAEVDDLTQKNIRLQSGHRKKSR